MIRTGIQWLSRHVPQVVVVLLATLYITLWLTSILFSDEQKKMGNTMMALPVSGSDAYEYSVLADNLLTKGEFTWDGTPETFRTPGYPLFIAAVRAIFVSDFFVTFIQILCTFGSAYLIYLLVRAGFGEVWSVVGVAAAVLFLIEPSVILHSLILMPESVFVFLFLAAFYLLLFGNIRYQLAFVLSGLCLGVAILVRPIAMFLPLVIAPFFYVFRKEQMLSTRLAQYGIFLLVTLTVVSPWIIRNYEVSGVAALSSLSAYNMYHYNLPEFLSVKEGVSPNIIRERFDAELPQEAQGHTRALQFSHNLSAISETVLKEQLFSYGVFHLIKTIPFFFTSSVQTVYASYNELFPNDSELRVRTANLSTLFIKGNTAALWQALVESPLVFLEYLWWAIILFFAAVGFFGMWRWPMSWLAASLIMYFAVLTGPVSYARYRIPVLPFLLSLGFIGLVVVVRFLRRRITGEAS